MAALVAFLGFVGVLVGLFAIVRGRLGWARLRTRRQATLATATAFLVMMVGALASPSPAPTAAPAASDNTPTTAGGSPSKAAPARRSPQPADPTAAASASRATATLAHRRQTSAPKSTVPTTTPSPLKRRTSTPARHRHPVSLRFGTQGVVLPDRHRTPGAVFSSASQARVCVTGYSARVRHVTETTRRAVFAAYGIPWTQHASYEVDHLIPLELGGSNATSNLWPEPQGVHDKGYPRKDLLENHLHALVCTGQVRLRTASTPSPPTGPPPTPTTSRSRSTIPLSTPITAPRRSRGGTGRRHRYLPGGGATAQCNDGSYSYAKLHQGACSHHGGVRTFYK